MTPAPDAPQRFDFDSGMTDEEAATFVCGVRSPAPDAPQADGLGPVLTDEEREGYACCLKPNLCHEDHFHQRDVEAILAARDRDHEAEVADLRSRLACVLEASYWDQGYDVRLAHIRGLCDLSTNGMTPAPVGDGPSS